MVVAFIILAALLIILLFGGLLFFFNRSLSVTNTSSTTSSPSMATGTATATTAAINNGQTQTCNPVDVSDPRFTKCYLLNTNIQDSSRFYDTVTDMTVATINPQTVPSATELCIQFCNSTTLPLTCSDPNFSSCVAALSSGCPIGKSNLISYFPIGRGFISCYPAKSTS